MDIWEGGPTMKVFITWSGETSRAIAQALHDFIPMVVQTVEAFMSVNDIEKGSRWEGEISRNLDEAKAGIICLTRDNLTAPWVLFEAGALSKKSADSSATVYTYLHGITATDVVPPLSTFQSTIANKEDTRRLIKNIKKVSSATLTDEALNRLFESMWPQLETSLANAPAVTKTVQRSEREMIEEILALARLLTTRRREQFVDNALEKAADVALKRLLGHRSLSELTNLGHEYIPSYKEVLQNFTDYMLKATELRRNVLLSGVDEKPENREKS